MDRFQKVAVIIAIVATIFVIVSVDLFLHVENETVIGEVTDVEFLDDYMAVTFDNGKTYNIAYPTSQLGSTTDLTVHSTMRLKLQKVDPIFFPNTDNVWTISNIVKVPEVKP